MSDAPSGGPSPSFNLEEALTRLDNDRELLLELVEMFDQDVPALMAAIRQAVDANDGPALSRAAHTLRGSLISFAAGDAVQAAQALETAGREGDLSQARTSFAALEAAMARLMPDLRALRSASA